MTVQLPQSFAEYVELALEMARAGVRAEFDMQPFGCRIVGTTHNGVPQPELVVECYEAELRARLIEDAQGVGNVDPNPRYLSNMSFVVRARD